MVWWLGDAQHSIRLVTVNKRHFLDQRFWCDNFYSSVKSYRTGTLFSLPCDVRAPEVLVRDPQQVVVFPKVHGADHPLVSAKGGGGHAIVRYSGAAVFVYKFVHSFGCACSV